MKKNHKRIVVCLIIMHLVYLFKFPPVSLSLTVAIKYTFYIFIPISIHPMPLNTKIKIFKIDSESVAKIYE